MTLAASASAGSVFSGWSGACTGTAVTCTVPMTAAKSVAATFQPLPSYTLTVGKSGTGSGKVTSTPTGISCGVICSKSYTSGSSVTLKAVAASGSTFAGWGGACTGTSSTCIVSVSAAKSVTATFNSMTACTASNMSIGQTVSGTWGATCTSSHRGSAYYATYYSFTLTAARTVTISLSSTAQDAYLYLLSGNSTGGGIITFDDDSGGGSNARISLNLPAGVYTLESTTYDAGATGAFTLTVQ